MRDPLDDHEVDERFADLVAHFSDPSIEPSRPPADGTPGAGETHQRHQAHDRGSPSPAAEVGAPDEGTPAAPQPEGSGVNRWDPTMFGLPPAGAPQDGSAPPDPPAPQPDGEQPPPSGPVSDQELLARLDPQWRMPTSERTFEELLDDEDDLGFTPDPVELPPPEDVHYWGALAALVSGPMVILYVVLGDPFYRTWWLLGGLGLVIGGFLLLILRMPARRDPYDGDDGARV